MNTVTKITNKNDVETLIITGSPHKNGHTSKLIARYLSKHAISADAIYSAYDMLPLPCIDCGFCKSVSHCTQRDLDEFYNDFEHCTRLIIAFPVYNAGLPSPMKAILDRMQVFYNARFYRNISPPIADPKSVSILTTQGSDKPYEKIILAQLEPVFTVTNCTLLEYICEKGTDRKHNQ